MRLNEPNRSKLYLGAFGLDVILVSIFILTLDSDAEITIYGHGLSIFMGVGFGILTCLYLSRVWDPVFIELKNPNANTADSRWMPIAVIGGIIFARLVLEQLRPEIAIFLTNIVFAWVIVLINYTAFQIWWHRPK